MRTTHATATRVWLAVLSVILAACTDSFSPNRDPIPVPRHRLAGSGSEMCLLDSAGAAHCWGQRGVRRLVPAEGLHFISISGGIDHLCGIANDSSAYCWGRATKGQLGNGRTTGGLSPERVETSTKFIAVAPATDATCALDALGMLYCWGNNSVAGLANGRRSDTETALSPQRAKSNVQFRDISRNCGVSLSRERSCWYSGKGGAYVDSPVHLAGKCDRFFYPYFNGADCMTPTPFDTDVRTSSAEGCLLDDEGIAYCAGDGPKGELGDGRAGSGVYAVRPTPVLSDVRFRVLSGLCGVARSGEAYCWGNNAFDQLGIGVSGGFRAVPTRVATDVRFVDIESNLNTCGLTATDEVWCWGPNEYGINGPTFVGSRSNVPVKVELPPE